MLKRLWNTILAYPIAFVLHVPRMLEEKKRQEEKFKFPGRNAANKLWQEFHQQISEIGYWLIVSSDEKTIEADLIDKNESDPFKKPDISDFVMRRIRQIIPNRFCGYPVNIKARSKI